MCTYSQKSKMVCTKKIKNINHAFVHLQEMSHSYIAVHLEMFSCWSASYSTFDKPIFYHYWSMQSTSWMFNVNGMRFAARSTIMGKAVSGNMLLQLTGVKKTKLVRPKDNICCHTSIHSCGSQCMVFFMHFPSTLSSCAFDSMVSEI